VKEALNAMNQSVSLFDPQSAVRFNEGKVKKLKVSKHILVYCKCSYSLLSSSYC